MATHSNGTSTRSKRGNKSTTNHGGESTYNYEYIFPTLPISLDEVYDRASRYTDKLLARPIFWDVESSEEVHDSIAKLPSFAAGHSRKRTTPTSPHHPAATFVTSPGNHGNEAGDHHKRSSSLPNNVHSVHGNHGTHQTSTGSAGRRLSIQPGSHGNEAGFLVHQNEGDFGNHG